MGRSGVGDEFIVVIVRVEPHVGAGNFLARAALSRGWLDVGQRATCTSGLGIQDRAYSLALNDAHVRCRLKTYVP